MQKLSFLCFCVCFSFSCEMIIHSFIHSFVQVSGARDAPSAGSGQRGHGHQCGKWLLSLIIIIVYLIRYIIIPVKLVICS